MPRHLPPEIRELLGPCREPEGLVEKVIEQCGLAKMMGDSGLGDFGPLVVVLKLVVNELEELGASLDDQNVRKAWCEIVERIQGGEGDLEHNCFFPCRYCDQTFRPTVDEKLLRLFLAWHQDEDDGTKHLLAIHCCPRCGGTLAAQEWKSQKGQGYETELGSSLSDEDWANYLLDDSEL